MAMNANVASAARTGAGAAKPLAFTSRIVGGQMPFRSEAQRRKFAQMVKEGKISQDEFNKWTLETLRQGNKLPDRLHAPKKPADSKKRK